MRISDWSSDVCSSDLGGEGRRDSFGGRIPDCREPGRTRPAFGAGHRAAGDGQWGNQRIAAMSWRVRAAAMGDLDALLELATMTGGGFTNLPPDRDALAAKLAWSEAAFARADGPPDDELRSEEHTSELQSLMRISYAVF